MAITTLDGALAGMQPPVEFMKALTGALVIGRPHSLFYTTGIPGAAVAPSPGITGEVVTSYPGQLPFTNPVTGNTYLARLQAQMTQAGTLLVCDRLWQNSGIDIASTGEQLFTDSLQIPARDATGTNTGVGVYAAVEVSSATGAGTPTLTLKYTSSDGTPNQTSTNLVATVASSIAGTFYPIGLAAGDKGIQKAQSLTLSATWTSGTIHVVLYRVLARMEIGTQTGSAIDSITSGFTQLYNNTTPFLVFIPSATTTSALTGHIIWTQG